MLTLGWLLRRRGGRRTARTVVLLGAVTAAVSCAASTATVEQTMVATATTAPKPEQKAAVLDAHGLRFKDALADSGLAAGVPDATLLAVARGLCSRLAAGVPEEQTVEVVRPIAAYAATVSDTTMPGDEAARHFIVIAREKFC